MAKLGPGARVGDQFNLLRKIGEGGCGEVYLAEQTTLGRNGSDYSASIFGALLDADEVHIWTDRPSRGLFDEYWPQGVGRPAETPTVPAELDWNLWIGPAPMRPYHPIYAPFKWRGWWDFG